MKTILNTSASNIALTPTDSASAMRGLRGLFLILLLPAAAGAQAICLTDAPEIGDIGPGSELVCEQLQTRFRDTALAVESRIIHSPTEVSVLASVHGAPIRLRYDLVGYLWHLTGGDNGMADAVSSEQSLSMHE